jgi:hypothetical protein
MYRYKEVQTRKKGQRTLMVQSTQQDSQSFYWSASMHYSENTTSLSLFSIHLLQTYLKDTSQAKFDMS